MTIFLRNNWQAKLNTIKLKVYPLSNKAKVLIDEIFDKLK